MHNHHHHIEEKQINLKRLIFTIILNSLITAAEVIGGILSGSLALLSDSLHNFSDVVAIVLSYIANRISRREKTLKNTFGYKRTEILIALLNAGVIIAVSIFLFMEAYERMIHPAPVETGIMLIVAVIGLLGNGISVILIKEDSHRNINVKSAYLHLMSDTLSSVAVVGGGILMYYYGLYWIDPVLTVLIGIYVMKEGYGIIKESVEILMQSAPEGIDIQVIKHRIENFSEINNLHHVHIWRLNDREIHFEGHIDLEENLTLKEIGEIQERIRELLHHEFNITHVTIQAEHNNCNEKDLLGP